MFTSSMNNESAQPTAVELRVPAGVKTVTTVAEPVILRVLKGVRVVSTEMVGKGGSVDNSVGLANPEGGTAWAV